jgi:hypothetical protein
LNFERGWAGSRYWKKKKIGDVWAVLMADLFCPDELEMAGVSIPLAVLESDGCGKWPNVT